MKLYLLLGSFLSQMFLCQTSDNDNCFEKEKRLYNSYGKKIDISVRNSKINIKNTLLISNKYTGLVGQFDQKNELFTVHENARIFPIDNSCVKVIFPTWTVENSYDKGGNLRKRQLIYKYSTYGTNQLFFSLQKNKKPLKSENIGDNLFKIKFEDFINILDLNGINKDRVKNFISKTASIYKYITPYGNYWEFYIRERDNYLFILVSDETGDVVSKSFDKDPNYPNKWTEYLHKRKEIFRIDDTYRLKENDVQNIIKDYIGRPQSGNLIFVKNEGLGSVENYQQYFNKTWLIRSHYNNNKIKPILMLVDDNTGEVLIDINNYPKNIEGENKFIGDFNELIIKRNQKN